MLITLLHRLGVAFLAATVPAPLTLATWVELGCIVTATVTVLVAVKTHVGPWVSVTLKRRSIERHDGARLFTAEGIARAMRYYITPLCQDIDPTGEEDLRVVVPARQKLFDALDDCLRRPGRRRYLMLLADSGMGKTSALLNLYVRHARRWRQPFGLAVVPLGDQRADEIIASIEDKQRTSLFLDALDEDPAAIRDLPARVKDIVQLTRDFRTVLITCRTQFFPSDMEMPRKVGVLRFDARPAGEEGEFLFYKLYLSPLDDRQVSKYLCRRYPFWRRGRRHAARELVARLSDLSARPMLLAHVDDILVSGNPVTSLGGAYDAIVWAWLQREAAFVEPRHLLNFSKRLAVELVANRDSRGGEKIPRTELSRLAEEWQVPLADWQLSARSLLNRDADGNYKFAHRSIMEFLFALRLTEFDRTSVALEWTDLIRRFALEFVDSFAYGRGRPEIDLSQLTDSFFAARFVSQLEGALPEPARAAEISNYFDASSSEARLLTLVESSRSSRPLQPFAADARNLERVTALLSRYSPFFTALMVLTENGETRLESTPLLEPFLSAQGPGFLLRVSSPRGGRWKTPNPRILDGIVNLVGLLRGQMPLPCAFFVTEQARGARHLVLSRLAGSS